MHSPPLPGTIGVLASGGLDSCILLGHLLGQGRSVQPFYVRTGVVWQAAEEAGIRRFLAAIAAEKLAPLVTLDLPLADVYDGHWSITGADTPGADTPDEAVYLPGRNALLLVKAAVWCQRYGIGELAMAPLGSSPFDDASEAFFRDFSSALNRGSPARVALLRPFGEFHKRQVMHLGRELPLELSFSCIAPVRGRGDMDLHCVHLHCGACNKCAERRAAFRGAELEDRTVYADSMR
jgi:7-cyano-7-deazaguanine synthase